MRVHLHTHGGATATVYRLASTPNKTTYIKIDCDENEITIFADNLCQIIELADSINEQAKELMVDQYRDQCSQNERGRVAGELKIDRSPMAVAPAVVTVRGPESIDEPDNETEREQFKQATAGYR